MNENLPDLGAINAARQIEKDAEEAREATAAQERVREWDQRMQRVFKGIRSRRERHLLLALALKHPANQ